jgi:hypothetical protein
VTTTNRPIPQDERLIVIDLEGGLVHGVETNIADLEGVKVLVLAGLKDSGGDREEIVIEGTDHIVYQSERVTVSDCACLLKPLAEYESRRGGARS